ncbi:MAG: hypothetical protein Q7R93_02510, partial [bacterium]|nr:hypothetical protein [bacterium]
FLDFGECPKPDTSFTDQEIALVRQGDPTHKILLTDGGEFGDWHRAAKRADVFGHTLYRTVYMDRYINLGRVTYPLTPEWYPMRVDFTRWAIDKPELPFMDIELGLEPWTKRQIYELPLEEQLSLFSMQNFHETIDYARRTRYKAHGMWGVEWWYYLKTKHNTPDYWDAAREVMRTGKGTLSP